MEFLNNLRDWERNLEIKEHIFKEHLQSLKQKEKLKIKELEEKEKELRQKLKVLTLASKEPIFSLQGLQMLSEVSKVQTPNKDNPLIRGNSELTKLFTHVKQSKKVYKSQENKLLQAKNEKALIQDRLNKLEAEESQKQQVLQKLKELESSIEDRVIKVGKAKEELEYAEKKFLLKFMVAKEDHLQKLNKLLKEELDEMIEQTRHNRDFEELYKIVTSLKTKVRTLEENYVSLRKFVLKTCATNIWE